MAVAGEGIDIVATGQGAESGWIKQQITPAEGYAVTPVICTIHLRRSLALRAAGAGEGRTMKQVTGGYRYRTTEA